jgi:hypothetical protein
MRLNVEKKPTIIIKYEMELRADQMQTHIDAVEQWSNVSIMADLIAKIKACSKNDLENGWLHFCWIGLNIRYDLNCQITQQRVFFGNEQVCIEGFASLYHEYCSLLSIKCWEISGYVKQTFLIPRKDPKKWAHAWNGIVLDPT